MRDVPRTRQRARQGPARPHLGGGPGQRLHTLPRGRQLAALRRRPLPPVHRRPGARHAAQARREAPPARVRQRTERGPEGFLERDAMRILHSLRGGAVTRDREVERAVEAAAREEPARASLWLSLAAQRRKLGLSARRLLQRSGTEMQALALRGVPDLRLDWLRRLSHAALIAQGAESWTGTLGATACTVTPSPAAARTGRCCSCTGWADRRTRSPRWCPRSCLSPRGWCSSSFPGTGGLRSRPRGPSPRANTGTS